MKNLTFVWVSVIPLDVTTHFLKSSTFPIRLRKTISLEKKIIPLPPGTTRLVYILALLTSFQECKSVINQIFFE